MIKIGILTFHRPINYGAFLQSYALSNRLSTELSDCDVEIIDYIAPKEKNKIYTNILRRIKKQGLIAGIAEIKKIRIFKKSLRYLKLSSSKYCTDKLDVLFKYINNEYDLLIIGSDAVFNWKQNGYPTAFIPNYQFTIPVYTYAASVHGLKFYDEPRNRIEACGQAFMKMNRVFTRDQCSEKFVKYCAPKCKVQHACDPTFLINFEQLYAIPHRNIDVIREKYRIKRPYIVLMIQNEEISRVIYEQYNKDFDIISLFINNRFSDCFLGDLTPVEWSMVLKYAKVVVTSYFHGTLLSLQQNVPVLVVDVSHYNGEYEGKLKDLMVFRLNLSELYFSIEDLKINEQIILNTIKECINGVYENKIISGVKAEKAVFKDFIDSIQTYMR